MPHLIRKKAKCIQKPADIRLPQANVATHQPRRHQAPACFCDSLPEWPQGLWCPATPRVSDSVTACKLLTPWLLRSSCCAAIFMLSVIFNPSHNIWGVGSLLFHQEKHLNILSSREFQGLWVESEAFAPDLSATSHHVGSISGWLGPGAGSLKELCRNDEEPVSDVRRGLVPPGVPRHSPRTPPPGGKLIGDTACLVTTPPLCQAEGQAELKPRVTGGEAPLGSAQLSPGWALTPDS